MSLILNFVQDQLLGMKWLNAAIGRILTALSIDVSTRLGGSIQFFLYDVIKITILLCVLIFFISYIQSYFPPERTRRILGRFHGLGANCLAALLGTTTDSLLGVSPPPQDFGGPVGAYIESPVPVVGSMISDASETVLVSAGILRSSAGVFGMLVVVAICLLPLIRLGVQHILLKLTAALSSTVGEKPLVDLIESVSDVMGFLMGMTGASGFMLLISCVCSIKVVGS